MPSKPRPKPFVAVRDIRYGGKTWRTGEEVTSRRAIDMLSKRGDKWITRAPKSAQAEPAAEVPADNPTPAETPKEG